MILVSPQEPSQFYVLGDVDPLPEEFGVDFMWESPMGKVGVQRKAFPGDFLSSIHDGRLNREYLQMQGLAVRVLMIEGRGRWSNDGVLIEQYGQKRMWTRSSHRRYLASVQLFRGVTVEQTEDQRDSVDFIKDFFIWTQKEEHLGLEGRPAAQAGDFWGKISSRDYYRYLLQSFPIIGPKIAENIIQQLGQIFKLDVTYEELLEVDGIGPTRAQKIIDVFGRHEQDE